MLIVLNEASIAFYKVSAYILQSQSRVRFHELQKPLSPILAPISCWSLAIVFAQVFMVTCQAATTSADNLNTSAGSLIDSMMTLDLARSLSVILGLEAPCHPLRSISSMAFLACWN